MFHDLWKKQIVHNGRSTASKFHVSKLYVKRLSYIFHKLFHLPKSKLSKPMEEFCTIMDVARDN